MDEEDEVSMELRAFQSNPLQDRDSDNIVDSLPYELFLHVCQYLDVAEFPVYSSVSRVWRERFSQSNVQEAFLKQWYTSEELRQLREAGQQSPEVLKDKLEHAHRFLSARPYSECYFEYTHNVRGHWFDSQQYHYSHGALALIETGEPGNRYCDTIRIYDFRSGEKSILGGQEYQEEFIGDDGEPFIMKYGWSQDDYEAIVVTEELVGFVGAGVRHCWAHSRRNGTITRIGVPDADLRCLSGRGHFLCLNIDDDIIVWDVATQSRYSFTIPRHFRRDTMVLGVHPPVRPQFDRATRILVAPEGDSVVVFYLDVDENKAHHIYDGTANQAFRPCALCFVRYTMTGDVISSQLLQTTMVAERPAYGGEVLRSFDIIPSGEHGIWAVLRAGVPCGQLGDPNTGGGYAVGVIAFDENSDCLFEYKRYDRRSSATQKYGPGTSKDNVAAPLHTEPGFVRWKDVCVAPKSVPKIIKGPVAGEEKATDADVHLRISRGKAQQSFDLPTTLQRRPYIDGWKTRILGDENVIILYLDKWHDSWRCDFEVRAYIFDKSIDLTNFVDEDDYPKTYSHGRSLPSEPYIAHATITLINGMDRHQLQRTDGVVH